MLNSTVQIIAMPPNSEDAVRLIRALDDDLRRRYPGIALDKNHRRNGIGRRLMEEAEEWARKRGCSVVRLWSSSARTDAHRFYRALGYTDIKTQYSFIKSLDVDVQDRLSQFVPMS
jgi:GNAT superfamily N-acetyltransferase